MKQWMIGFVSFLIVSTSLAMPKQFCDSWYINFGGGVNFPRTTQNAFVTTGPGWPDDLYIGSSTENTPIATVGFGYTWFNTADTLDNYWLPFFSLGLSYSYIFQSQIKGRIQQYSLSQFENYTFQYQVQRQTILALAKLDIYRWRVIMPYLILGAGVSFNRSTNYSEQANPNVTPRISPGFNSNTQSHSSALAGLGLDLMVQDNLWASFEYDYGYYGYSKTGFGQNDANVTGFNYANSALSNKLTSSTALFILTYFFENT